MRINVYITLIILGRSCLLPEVQAQEQLDCPSRTEARPLEYQLREDHRCEGIYPRPVSGSRTLLVRSLTGRFDSFDAGLPEKLRVQWSLPSSSAIVPVKDSSQSILVRVRPMRYRENYAMTTERNLIDTVYEWPTNVLSRVQVNSSDIGIVASTEVDVDNIPREVFLPVWLTLPGTTVSNNVQYELGLFPLVRISAAYLTIHKLDNRGIPVDEIIEGRNIGTSAAETAMRVTLPQLPEHGLYEVTISAELRRKNRFPAVTRIWLYHNAE